MKKLIVLSAGFLFVLGAFATPVITGEQNNAKPATQTAPASKTPAKTESKPANKKDAKETKKAKKAKSK